jgi:hypothetical protein
LPEPGWRLVKSWFAGFGVLRLMLAGASAILVLMGPFSGGQVRLEGAAVLTTLVAPVAYAVFVFVLPLDMTMTGIFMSDAAPERRRALKRVLITEALLLAALLLSWLPFLIRLLDAR